MAVRLAAGESTFSQQAAVNAINDWTMETSSLVRKTVECRFAAVDHARWVNGGRLAFSCEREVLVFPRTAFRSIRVCCGLAVIGQNHLLSHRSTRRLGCFVRPSINR